MFVNTAYNLFNLLAQNVNIKRQTSTFLYAGANDAAAVGARPGMRMPFNCLPDYDDFGGYLHNGIDIARVFNLHRSVCCLVEKVLSSCRCDLMRILGTVAYTTYLNLSKNLAIAYNLSTIPLQYWTIIVFLFYILIAWGIGVGMYGGGGWAELSNSTEAYFCAALKYMYTTLILTSAPPKTQYFCCLSGIGRILGVIFMLLDESIPRLLILFKSLLESLGRSAEAYLDPLVHNCCQKCTGVQNSTYTFTSKRRGIRIEIVILLVCVRVAPLVTQT
uniref:Uncharacterized protein n=1 Tax=Glossina brevipalpis TaxID=37001 RepID=A0A1A9WUX3_9MUSC